MVIPRRHLRVAVIDAVYPSRLGVEFEIAQHGGMTVSSFGSCEEAVDSGVGYDVAVVDPKYLPGISGVAAVRALAAGFALVVVYTVDTGPFASLEDGTFGGVVVVRSKTRCPVALLIRVFASYFERSCGLQPASGSGEQFGRRLPTRKQMQVLGYIATGAMPTLLDTSVSTRKRSSIT